MHRPTIAIWIARLTVGLVFFFNVECAVAFIVRPEAYAPSFEVSGAPGEALVRGMGILFLMWNTTYPLVLWNPRRYRWLFLLVIIQQVIGLTGELWMLWTLPEGHRTLARTGWRFSVFDGGGLAAMLAAYGLLCWSLRHLRSSHLEDHDGNNA